jgi:ubiquitin carboxyl-terminal hydrolase 4/11/15
VKARSEDAIRRKILEKVATFTTHPAFDEQESDAADEDEGLNDATDPDLVVTNASDADSSGDGKVVATSVDGEDFVDVTMKDSNGAGQSAEPPRSEALNSSSGNGDS